MERKSVPYLFLKNYLSLWNRYRTRIGTLAVLDTSTSKKTTGTVFQFNVFVKHCCNIIPVWWWKIHRYMVPNGYLSTVSIYLSIYRYLFFYRCTLPVLMIRRAVDCLTWDRYNPAQLVSTSSDGTSRIFDLVQQQHRLISYTGARKFVFCSYPDLVLSVQNRILIWPVFHP